MATGAILALNLLSSSTEAYVDYGPLFPAPNAAPIQAGTGVAVSATDSVRIDATVTLGSKIDLSGGGTGSGQSLAGVVSLNYVQGGATAWIEDAIVQAGGGAVQVSARESAAITANTTSEVAVKSASSGSGSPPTYGNASSLGAGGIVGINVVQGPAGAQVLRSSITATDVFVEATNGARLTATTTDAAEVSTDPGSGSSGGSSGGTGSTATATLTLALNITGYDAKNALFQAIDALLGQPVAADAYGDDVGSGATARLLDTTVTATGQLAVRAHANATLIASVTNTSSTGSDGL